MKLILAMIALLVLCLSSLTFAAEEEKTLEEKLMTPSGKLSYALGLDTGASLRELVTEIDSDIFVRGLEDGLKGEKFLLTPEETIKVKRKFFDKIQKEREQKLIALAEKNQKEEKAFLAALKKEEKGVITTASGLHYMVMHEGDGPQPKAKDSVTVNYRGTLIDGTEFDSSYKREQPSTFPVNKVIPGWREALQLMKVGSRHRLFIPSKLAYGKRGMGPIGPNALLIFEVELLAIEK